MKLYLLKITESVGYDEYDAVVVSASSESDAKQVAAGHLLFDYYDVEIELISEVSLVKRGIVLSSFNAG